MKKFMNNTFKIISLNNSYFRMNGKQVGGIVVKLNTSSGSHRENENMTLI